jgi:hypothetical protein
MATVLAGIACASPTNLPMGIALMILGGFTLTRAPTTALGIRPGRAQDLRHRLGASRRPCIPLQWLTSVGDGLDPGWPWRQLDVGVFTTRRFACPVCNGYGLGQSRDSRHEPSPSGGNPMPGPGAAPHSPRLLGSIGGWFRSTQYSPSCRMASVNCSKSTGFTM